MVPIWCFINLTKMKRNQNNDGAAVLLKNVYPVCWLSTVSVSILMTFKITFNLSYSILDEANKTSMIFSDF